jgi:hypothetical protein
MSDSTKTLQDVKALLQEAAQIVADLEASDTAKAVSETPEPDNPTPPTAQE